MALRMADSSIRPLAAPAAPAGQRTVTPQKQERYNWCWAACCSMALQAAQVTPARAQCAIAISYFKSMVNCCNPQACDYECLIKDVETVFRTNGLSAAQLVSLTAQQPLESDLVGYLRQSSVAAGLQGTGSLSSLNHMVLVVRQAGQLYMVADPANGSYGPSSFANLLQSSTAHRQWAWTWKDLQ
jgi:hypothetical protein